MERYPRGPRGHPAKVLVRAIVARVQISLSPPQGSCTHNHESDECVLFCLHDGFGAVWPFEKPKRTKQKRDGQGNFCK